MDVSKIEKFMQSTMVGVVGIILVLTASYESITTGQIDPALLALVTAVVATYFTGTAVRQVNGSKVEALTTSVDALHKRFDEAGIVKEQG